MELFIGFLVFAFVGGMWLWNGRPTRRAVILLGLIFALVVAYFVFNRL